MTRRFTLALVSFVAIGCATANTTTNVPPERVVAVDERSGASVRTQNDPTGVTSTIQGTTDQVWDATALSFVFLKIPVTYSNRPAGEQGNPNFVMIRNFDGQPLSAYLNCGDDPISGPNANLGRVTVAIVAKIRPGTSGTVLETLLTGNVVKSGASSAPIYCSTTGTFEKHFADMVASRVNK